MRGPRSASELPESPADVPWGSPWTLVADSGLSTRGSEGCAGSLVVESATHTITAGRPRLQTTRVTKPPADQAIAHRVIVPPASCLRLEAGNCASLLTDRQRNR